MNVSDIAANILVYKTLKLLSSPYDKWSYFKQGIIDKDGKVLKSKSATSYMKFVINIKKLVTFHPMGRLKLSSLPLALTLLREQHNNEFIINEELLISEMKLHGMIEK